MELLAKVWPQWKVVKNLGEGSFGKVFEIERKDMGGTYKAALKVITIPKNPGEVNDVLSEGMDVSSVTEYFYGMMEEIVKEFAMMEKLKGNTNIVSYEDHEVVPHEGDIGWDILIRMELLTPLTKYIGNQNLEEKDVIKLGIDMCKALELCQQYNIIHRDIKPENIFISETGDFKLGDFGVARTAENTMSGMSKKGTYTYMAPEVYKGEAYNATVDLYSLGIVLYRLLNDNRTPFLPAAPEPIRFSDREMAQERRFKGETFPAPAHASEGMRSIINTACAYQPEKRYANAAQIHRDLEALLRNPELVFEEKYREGEEEWNNTVGLPKPDWSKVASSEQVSEVVTLPTQEYVQPEEAVIEEALLERTVVERKTADGVVKEPRTALGVVFETVRENEDVVTPMVNSEPVGEPQVDEILLSEAREELRRKQKECAEAGVSEKNQLVAVILALFLNSMGAPFFYLGHAKKGFLCLLLSFISMPLGLVPVVLGVVFYGWIYAFRIGTGEAKDKDGKYVLSKSQKKAWVTTK